MVKLAKTGIGATNKVAANNKPEKPRLKVVENVIEKFTTPPVCPRVEGQGGSELEGAAELAGQARDARRIISVRVQDIRAHKGAINVIKRGRALGLIMSVCGLV